MSNVPAFRCDRCGETVVGKKPQRIVLLGKDYCDECAVKFTAFLEGVDALDKVTPPLPAKLDASYPKSVFGQKSRRRIGAGYGQLANMRGDTVDSDSMAKRALPTASRGN